MKRQNYQWYILSLRGGKEEKVIKKIKSELEKKGWSSRLKELKVVSDSQKKNILKGYILCRCYLTSELTHFFYQVPKIIGFLNHQRGDAKLPSPVSETVVKNFLTKVEEKGIKLNNYEEIELIPRDLVEISEGEFAGQEGRVVQFDKKKQKVTILIESSGWEIKDVPVNICKKVLN